MGRHLVEGGPYLRLSTYQRKYKGFLKAVICDISFYSGVISGGTFEAMKINFSMKRATGIEKKFGLFGKFKTNVCVI